MSTQFTFGADPELFVQDKATKKFVSGWGLVNGDKKNPLKVEHGAVQVDGMALEFNIDPSRTKREFMNNISKVRQQLKDMVGPNLALVPEATVDFEDDIWNNVPDEAKELGCDPDFDAWNNGAANPRPNNNVKFRTGAGHLHVGWIDGVDAHDPTHMEACIMLTKQLDWSLGLWSVLHDDDVRRRSLYGSAGAFRPKPYGCEYRVLSNFWLKNRNLTSSTYSIAKKAVKDLENGTFYGSWFGVGTRVKKVLRESNKNYAFEYLKFISRQTGYDFVGA